MTVIVQLSNLGIHYLANGKLIRYLLYTLTGNLRDVNQAIDTGDDLRKGAEVRDMILTGTTSPT